MSSRVIPIKAATKTVPLVGEIRRDDTHWIDSRGRPLRDVRISITDRCNFRCRYCMPKEKFEKDHCFLSHTEVLSFEEIIRLGRIFAANGVEKIRLTGGEPLLRKGIEFLIEELSKLKTWNGKPLDVAVTTNGAALSAKAKSLAAAGLKRLTVSLDAMDPQIYKDLNDVNFPIEKTLAGIQAAKDAGIPSIKINVVVKRGVNEKELIKIAEHFKGTGIIVRYIEFMDVGTSNGWRLDDVIPSRQIVEEINRVYPIEPLDPNYTGEVATRWAYKDGSGELGFISSVSEFVYPLTANSTNAFLRRRASTFAKCSEEVPRMKKSRKPSDEFGQRETNIIPKFERKRPSKPGPASELRCLTSAVRINAHGFSLTFR